MSENLRTYSRLLTSQLKEKEEELIDLKNRFSKLENRFAQLDYAFKNNLQLHQQQIIEIHELRDTQKELRRIGEKRCEEYRELEERLTRVTREKESAQKELDHRKQATIDENKYHEGKYEELMRSYNLRLREERTILENKIKETERRTKLYIQELSNLKKAEEDKTEAIRKKAIVLQGDVDVLKYRTKELAELFETWPQINEILKSTGFCIVKVLKSFTLSNEEYEARMKELRGTLIGQNFAGTSQQKNDISLDDEPLKVQNLVLREVVKKLKNDLGQLKKSEADRVGEEKCRKNHSSEELSHYMRKNEELRNEIASKDDQIIKLSKNKEEKFELKCETGFELFTAKDNQGKIKGNVNVDRFVQTDAILDGYSGSKESREFENRKSFEAYWMQRKKRAEKTEERVTRDEMKSSGLNFSPFNFDGRTFDGNYGVLKNGEKIAENFDDVYSLVRLEPVESHLNSIRYKEYTISFGRKDNLKIRHPIKSDEGIFRLLSVRSEEEYQNTPADKAVLYFDFENIVVAPFPTFISQSSNCGIQTLPIETANVFSQTITSKEFLTNLAGTAGVKILNSERRAIERSLRDLEKTISETSKETLEEARAFIVSSTKFPPSEEFFDCIQYLSKS